MTALTANRTAIGLYRTEVQTTTCKHSIISVIHQIIAFIQTFFIHIKGIRIFHNKFTTAHQAKTRPALITIFSLNLIPKLRQLFIRTHIITENHANHFFMSWPQTKIPAITVFHTPKFSAINIPTAAFLPDFSRLHCRH